jgi:hypothetical protein
MSSLAQILPEPIPSTFTPAAATSASAFAPHGVREPSSGGGESTIGNTGRPLTRIVGPCLGFGVDGCAAPARLDASTAAAAALQRSLITERLTPTCPHRVKKRRRFRRLFE